jgi:polar amino acid transport system substrate-binding protein
MKARPGGRRAAAVALLAAGAAALWAAEAARADTIRIRADGWCPYNCDPGSDRPGYMIEVAREVFAAAGHEVDYRTSSWMRSLDDARGGRIEAVVGATAGEAEGLVIPAEPLGRTRDGYAMRKGDRPDGAAGPPAFERLVVGAVRGYEYSGPLAAHVRAHGDDPARVQFVTGDDALEKNLRKLASGRVDLVPDDAGRLRAAIRDLGLGGALEVVHEGDPNPLYIAFSPSDPRSPAYAALLSEGVVRLRASGRLAAILARYGLADWEDPS